MSNDHLPLGHAISARQRRVLQAFFDTVYASDDPNHTKPSQVDVAGRFSHWLSQGEKLTLLGFKFAIWALNWIAPLLFLGKLRRFVSLSDESKLRLVERWLNLDFYPVRMLLFGIYLMGAIVYFDLDEVKKDLGSDQRCLLDVLEEVPQ
ncbi:MAG: hypothetical protein P9M14_17600 [Candidatus Alcyoniella australis]|nr:hypothetical protein [Candidatus Alcyoniella australis]